MNEKDYLKSFIMKWNFTGIAFICLLGTLMHFVFEWSNENNFIGAIVPINESVAEHLKMVLWPTLIYYVIGYFVIKKKFGVFFNKWFTACLISVFVNIVLILSIHYIIVYGIGIEFFVTDIVAYLAGTTLGQLTATNYYNSNRYNKISGAALFILGIFIIASIVFTYYPLDIPLFMN